MPPQVPGEGEAAEPPLWQLRGPGHVLQSLYPLQRVPHTAQPHLRGTHISSRPLYSRYWVRTPAGKGPWPSSCCCCQGNCAVLLLVRDAGEAGSRAEWHARMRGCVGGWRSRPEPVQGAGDLAGGLWGGGPLSHLQPSSVAMETTRAASRVPADTAIESEEETATRALFCPSGSPPGALTKQLPQLASHKQEI